MQKKKLDTKLYTYNLNILYILQRRFTNGDVFSLCYCFLFICILFGVIAFLIFGEKPSEKCTAGTWDWYKDIHCCSYRFFGSGNCRENEGGCMNDDDCGAGLYCGKNNCPEGFPSDYNCCRKWTGNLYHCSFKNFSYYLIITMAFYVVYL